MAVVERRARKLVKQRHIALAGAGDGAALLGAVNALGGVRDAALRGSDLRLSYVPEQVSLQEIEALARRCGFTPAGGLAARLRRSLVHYRESIRRERREHEAGWDVYVRNAYMSRYRNRRHGRIDDRPQQWRRYLEREAGSGDRD